MNTKFLNYTLVLIISLATAKQGFGQLHTLEAGYFQNQYLMNPAMSGLENGKFRRNMLNLYRAHIVGESYERRFLSEVGSRSG